jgi:hypothetical protein
MHVRVRVGAKLHNVASLLRILHTSQRLPQRTDLRNDRDAVNQGGMGGVDGRERSQRGQEKLSGFEFQFPFYPNSTKITCKNIVEMIEISSSRETMV